jgi:hypothetical protein
MIGEGPVIGTVSLSSWIWIAVIRYLIMKKVDHSSNVYGDCHILAVM